MIGFYGRIAVAFLSIAALLAVCASFGFMDQLNNSFVISFISNITPSVNWVALQTSYIKSARVSYSIQWIFFPVYLFLFCVYRKPWKLQRAETPSSRKDLLLRSRKLIPFFLILLFMIFTDWNIVPGPSIYRGTIWERMAPMSSLPYSGRTGLAIAAFLSPLFEATVYWIALSAVTRFFIPAVLPVKPAVQPENM